MVFRELGERHERRPEPLPVRGGVAAVRGHHPDKERVHGDAELCTDSVTDLRARIEALGVDAVRHVQRVEMERVHQVLTEPAHRDRLHTLMRQHSEHRWGDRIVIDWRPDRERRPVIPLVRCQRPRIVKEDDLVSPEVFRVRHHCPVAEHVVGRVHRHPVPLET